jgi:hypothetical protein
MLMRVLLSPVLAIAVLLTAAAVTPTEAIELSAAKTTKKKVRVVSPHPAPQPIAVYRWRPADPSFDQNGRLYRPPPGLYCPIDLGYGRWGSCTNR